MELVLVNVILFTVLGLAPGFTWLMFYLQEDLRHPEPKKLIFYAFLAGAFITLIVLQLQYIAHSWLSNFNAEPYGATAFVVFAGIEEFFKFLAVYLVVRHKKEFDEPVDAMIYMIVAALGFASVENIASVFQANGSFYPNPGPVETTMLRFVGATLLHSLTAGFIGYEWGRAMIKKDRPGRYIAIGIIGATLLHAIFNYLIIKSGPVTLPLIFLIFLAPFVLEEFEILKHDSK